jgi:hypothetical protein
MKIGFGYLKVTAHTGNDNKAVHMAWVTNPISEPSFDISPNWISLISNEVINKQRSG